MKVEPINNELRNNISMYASKKEIQMITKLKTS